MNVETDTTAEAGSATAARPYMGDAYDEATTTLHLFRAATLLMRHIVLNKAKEEVITCSQDDAETIHELLDLAWSRSNSTVEEIETVWGRASR